MKKETENLTKLAQAIATLRKSGLTVTDETKKGGSIGIAGVHEHRGQFVKQACKQLGVCQ